MLSEANNIIPRTALKKEKSEAGQNQVLTEKDLIDPSVDKA